MLYAETRLGCLLGLRKPRRRISTSAKPNGTMQQPRLINDSLSRGMRKAFSAVYCLEGSFAGKGTSPIGQGTVGVC
jgi:hypothetical protein